MLDRFRSGMRGIALVIVVFIAIIFTFSGVGSMSMTGSGGPTAASVDGDVITEQDVALELQQTKSRILNENEGLRFDQLDDEMLRPGVVDRLIANRALSQSADGSGMVVPARAVAEILKNAEGFQTDGVFDKDRYRSFVRGRGLTNAQFKQQLADDLLRGQLVSGYRQSSFLTQGELQLLAEVAAQTRDYYYLILPLQPILDSVVASEEALQSYYQDNLSDFESEEQVILDYIELSADVLVLDDPVSEADILARFTEESDGAVGSTSRRAAHILLDADNDGVVDEILTSIAAGESFADLAERYSTDAGSAGIGGDLGFSDGSLFPESFESALAALEVGKVSGPVVTDSGIHLIKLLEIDETTFEFDSESARIASQLQRERADALSLEKLAQLRELSYNAESLAEIAQDTGLVASVSEPMSRRGGAGIGAIPEVIESAFSDEVLLDKYASEVLVLEDDRYVVVKLKEHIMAYQKPFEEVEDDVASAYAVLRGGELLAQQGRELMARVDAGASVEDVAKANDLDWQVALEARRSSPGVNAEVNQFAFRLVGATTPANDSFINRKGDFVIVSLQRSVAGDYDSMSSTDQRALKDAVLQAAANREISAFQQALVENAAVVR